MSDNQREIEDLEADIQELEGMISEEEKQLAYLQSEDYKPEDNPDDELRDQDIEFHQEEIGVMRREVAKFQRRIERLKRAQQSVHLTAEPSGKIETNIDEDALHQWVYGATRRR